MVTVKTKLMWLVAGMGFLGISKRYFWGSQNPKAQTGHHNLWGQTLFCYRETDNIIFNCRRLIKCCLRLVLSLGFFYGYLLVAIHPLAKAEELLAKDKIVKNQDLEKKLGQLSRKINILEERLDKLNHEFDRLSALEISGFFDVSLSNYKNKPNVFSIGNFELDIAHSYENNFQVAAALVFDDEQGTYLGVGFIDYSLYGDIAVARGRIFREKGFHIQIGRFDVPLGNDWNHVSAVDRITVTSPLTTENLMEGVYNDVGIRFLVNFVSFNATVYSTHGVEAKQSYGGTTYGFRLGLTPFNNPYTMKQSTIPVFEAGVSYLYDTDRDNKESEQILAIDYESQLDFLILRAEYFQRKKIVGIVFDGYHLTTALDFGEIIASRLLTYFRYDYHREKDNVIASFEQTAAEDVNQEEHLTRLTVGVNFNISDISHLKFEYQNYIESTDKFNSHDYFAKVLYYAQLVIIF